MIYREGTEALYAADAAVERAIALGPEATVEEVVQSGLRGAYVAPMVVEIDRAERLDHLVDRRRVTPRRDMAIARDGQPAAHAVVNSSGLSARFSAVARFSASR